MAGLQSELTAAHQLNHDLVCGSCLLLFVVGRKSCTLHKCCPVFLLLLLGDRGNRYTSAAFVLVVLGVKLSVCIGCKTVD